MVRVQLRRTTFHDFMLDVHFRLHRQERTADPLTRVAAQLVSEFKVLCLDEFFVTDVADATMLNRLFSQMWERGLVFVATSNRYSLSIPLLSQASLACSSHLAGSCGSGQLCISWGAPQPMDWYISPKRSVSLGRPMAGMLLQWQCLHAVQERLQQEGFSPSELSVFAGMMWVQVLGSSNMLGIRKSL